ncbi:ABC transporter permease [Halomonas campisalis]|uniref:ABC transporter permease n=1 Tax=Billgrantia campisalis TaxID=74661 RepID=A0ABS9P5Y4_9GAMM|nr:ABC transporter permease [Halomonas campisalis]MCG6657185.1 ABC transporter permease [Halomonas campisalis]MDR5862370.1 ABC transporter permease [Halomonas campisalis]
MTHTATHAGTLEQGDEGLRAVGDWTLPHHSRLRREVAKVRGTETLDLTPLGRLDTSGAVLLVELLGAQRVLRVGDWAPALPAEQQALLVAVADAMREPLDIAPPSVFPPLAALADLGQRVAGLGHQQFQLIGFIGVTLASLVSGLLRPRRWRITALVAQLQQSGLNAIPIVALLTFLVGAVVAFLGATVLRDFGATIYTVNLVAYSFLREFGVLLAAILLAGRTASAFTAQIGAMKANEELDAIRTLGLSPVELLVLPRVLAMMISLPILTLVGMLSGMLGGALVCSLALEIPLAQFLAILQRDIPLNHFLVGLAKAPLFAFLIAVIGCLEGFKAAGSAQSVGEHTTSSVVQSIFMVILLDALAALFFMEMGW